MQGKLPIEERPAAASVTTLVVVIPAYQPGRAMVDIVQELACAGMTAIVVVCFNGASYYLVGGGMALTLLSANVFVGLLIVIISTLLPPAPATNRRLTVLGSRYSKTPLPSPS